HVVADKATVDRRAAHPGFMDGHGVVSGDHIHDLLDDPTTVIRPLGPDDELAVFLTTLNNLDDIGDPDGSTDSDDLDGVGESARPNDLDCDEVGDPTDSDGVGESARPN
ncbi:hypothetical protein HH308_29415, partial [Gordonia sp. TBRC 11910]|nr:hypothetical protein [Gordonia asplenii]